MKTRIYQLYAAIAADTDDAAHVDIQRPGMLHTVGLVVTPTLSNGTGQIELEVSFSSTGQIRTNDAHGPIFGHGVTFALNTSGGYALGSSVYVPGLAIMLKAGDRLYLHGEVTGTILPYVRAFLYVGEK